MKQHELGKADNQNGMVSPKKIGPVEHIYAVLQTVAAQNSMPEADDEIRAARIGSLEQIDTIVEVKLAIKQLHQLSSQLDKASSIIKQNVIELEPTHSTRAVAYDASISGPYSAYEQARLDLKNIERAQEHVDFLLKKLALTQHQFKAQLKRCLKGSDLPIPCSTDPHFLPKRLCLEVPTPDIIQAQVEQAKVNRIRKSGRLNVKPFGPTEPRSPTDNETPTLYSEVIPMAWSKKAK